MTMGSTLDAITEPAVASRAVALSNLKLRMAMDVSKLCCW
jgi:hypothetical protein